MSTRTGLFALGAPRAATWTSGSDAVRFLRSGPSALAASLWEFRVDTGTAVELAGPGALLAAARAEGATGEGEAGPDAAWVRRVQAEGLTGFRVAPVGDRILVQAGGRWFWGEGTLRPVPWVPLGSGVEDPQFAPDGSRLAFVRDHNLQVLDLDRGRERALTSEGTEVVSYGLAEYVARVEMKRPHGFWWSPDSRALAYQESDATGVEAWRVADPARPDHPPRLAFYPRPGRANVQVRIGIVGVRGGRTTWIEWDCERYPYVARVDWPSREGLTLTVQRRDQKEVVLLQADPRTGQTRTLLSEQDPTWVNLDAEVPRGLGGGRGFLWTSEREGAWQLEWRHPQGGLQQVLIPPAAGYHRLVGVDETRGYVYALTRPDPTRTEMVRVSLTGGAAVRLTSEPGVHAVQWSPDYDHYLDERRSASAWPRYRVCRADGSRIGELPSVAETPSLLPQGELVVVGDPPGWHALVVRPRRAPPTGRWPVLVDAYGGPRTQTVQADAGSWLLHQWLADEGFVVVTLDGRGTPGRGRAWERALHRRLGDVPLADQVAGLQALGRRFPELDLERVGIFGWSFGGYLAVRAVLRHPDVFHAAVAGAPVTDWHDYDTHYTERYLGLPAEDPEAYVSASLLPEAGTLRRPLRLVHGTADDNVHFRHTLRLVDALFRANRPFELAPLPGTSHQILDPAVVEQHWLQLATFFRRHLVETHPSAVAPPRSAPKGSP